ncbi:hypothetical protein J6590_094908 [Homalodisca vitripennis]|nr:hypothetical protein J6590_094908 [Homalodisca vitripennis]
MEFWWGCTITQTPGTLLFEDTPLPHKIVGFLKFLTCYRGACGDDWDGGASSFAVLGGAVACKARIYSGAAPVQNHWEDRSGKLRHLRVPQVTWVGAPTSSEAGTSYLHLSSGHFFSL